MERILVLPRDLINFVNVDDALLSLGHVAIGVLQQFQNNVFNIFAHVTGLGERGGVHNRERHLEHARQSLRQKRLAGSRGPDQENIRLGQFHVAGLAVQEDPLVMVIDRDGELLFGLFLADHVTVEERFNLRRPRQAPVRGRGVLALFVFENLLADGDALIADIGTLKLRGGAMSFSTWSCVLWQNEQRSASSEVMRFKIWTPFAASGAVNSPRSRNPQRAPEFSFLSQEPEESEP